MIQPCVQRRPTRPGIYDNAVSDNKVTIAIRKAEAVWKAKIQDWRLYDVAKEEARRFIIDCVEDVWLVELKKNATVYVKVKAIKMIEHLCKTRRGTHEIDILGLKDQMRELHLKMETISPITSRPWRRRRNKPSALRTRCWMSWL